MQEILNIKTCRCYNKGMEDRIIRVEDTRIHISRAADKFLGISDTDRLTFVVDSGKIYFMYDKKDGFPVHIKKHDKRCYIYNSHLARKIRKYGKIFVIDEFKEGKYILKPLSK